MAQTVKQPLVPWLGRNSYITEDVYIKGGFRSVATKRSRDQIPLSSRKAGMMVYCVETDTHYKLKTDLATWQIFTGADVVINPQAGSGDTTAGNGAVGIQIQQIANATAMTQDPFTSASVCAFDYTNCPEAPNYIAGGTSSIVGLNFSTDGNRIAQLGISVLGGTPTLYFRTKADSNSAWTTWTPAGAGGSGGSSASTTIPVTLSAHGFTPGAVIAVDVTGAYVAAKADNPATSEVVGICSSVNSPNSFNLTTSGLISNLFTGMIPGRTYYVSTTTAGVLQEAAPSAAGHVSKPVLVAISSSSGFLNIQRGFVIPEPLITTATAPLDTGALATQGNTITIDNNFGTPYPFVQVMDTTGRIRNDVLITVTPNELSFNFGNVSGATGIWKAVVVG